MDTRTPTTAQEATPAPAETIHGGEDRWSSATEETGLPETPEKRGHLKSCHDDDL